MTEKAKHRELIDSLDLSSRGIFSAGRAVGWLEKGARGEQEVRQAFLGTPQESRQQRQEKHFPL